MTDANDLLIDLALKSRDAFDPDAYDVDARRTDRGLELTAQRVDAPDVKGTAVLNVGEVLEFPHLGRLESTIGDLRAYVDALEGHANPTRLGQIPAGRIPELDTALLEGKITAGGRRLGQWRP